MAGGGARARRKARRGQDELTRRRRLMNGCCPTHGLQMPQVDVVRDDYGNPLGPVIQCPRKDCTFTARVEIGTKLYESLFGE